MELNNIILVGYGKEELSKLHNADILKDLQDGFYLSLKLTEDVHINPKDGWIQMMKIQK